MLYNLLLSLLSIALFTNLYKPKTRNIFLAYFITIVLFVILPSTPIFSPDIQNIFSKSLLLFFSDFYYGPILYLYLRTILKLKTTWKTFLSHSLSPFILTFLSILIVSFDLGTPVFLRYVFPPLSSVILLAYLVAGYLLIKREEHNLQAKFRYRGFYFLINIYFVFDSVFTFASLIYFTQSKFVEPIKNGLLTASKFYYENLQIILFAIFGILLFIYAITESLWLKRYFMVETLKPKVDAIEQDLKVIHHDLSKNKRELDSNLNQSRYLKLIGVSKEALVTYLKSHGFDNFRDFCNARRIENFKELIADENYSNYSIEGLAFESGFQSKASFYRIFKKVQGVNPIQYKNDLKVNI